MSTNITDEHRRAFQALTGGDYDNFGLFPCFIDGTPGTAIVAVNECPAAAEGRQTEYAVLPLFVSVTRTMTITDHDCTEA